MTDTQDNILRLAIQKKGRLSEGSLELLKKCGLTVSHGRDKLYARIEELPIDVLLVRDDDIPAFVGDGASDIGIVGQNVFEEEILTAGHEGVGDEIMALGFSGCRLCIALPKDETYAEAKALEGKRIATSYPGITDRWLKQQGVSAKTVMMNGAVEIAPRLNIADAICDIVSTGATLDANGLKPVETIYRSEAILIKSRQALSPAKQETYDALLKRIRGVQESRGAKYVMMNAPAEAVAAITEVLPGAEAPTILQLAGNDKMVAIHAVCRESVFWETLEELKKRGASDVLVLNIEKMMA
jgi:ATP phosphoribosyltransferase